MRFLAVCVLFTALAVVAATNPAEEEVQKIVKREITENQQQLQPGQGQEPGQGRNQQKNPGKPHFGQGQKRVLPIRPGQAQQPGQGGQQSEQVEKQTVQGDQQKEKQPEQDSQQQVQPGQGQEPGQGRNQQKNPGKPHFGQGQKRVLPIRPGQAQQPGQGGQ